MACEQHEEVSNKSQSACKHHHYMCSPVLESSLADNSVVLTSECMDRNEDVVGALRSGFQFAVSKSGKMGVRVLRT